MPNGESKNWVRFQITLESFNILYKKWPTVIYLDPFFIAELKEKLSNEDFELLQSKIKLEQDEENPFTAFDELNNKFNYGSGRPIGQPSVRAIEWLKISEPDYYD